MKTSSKVIVSVKVLVPALLLAVWSLISPASADEARLSLEEARQYMLELINKDRAANGLKPVALDDAANRAAQKHAEEMATNVYLSHLNLAGQKPDQRYTEAGGVDAVMENTYFWYWGEAKQLALQTPAQTFAKTDIEAIQGTYMAEVPPLDGHRRNILQPLHTHVGIGLGRAAEGNKGLCLTNTQEFVQRYLELDAIEQSATGGAKIKVSGKASAAKPLYAVAIGREDLPSPKTREELAQFTSYRPPQPTIWYWAGRDFKTKNDGRFEAVIEIPKNAPGVYYISVWLRDDPRKTGMDGLFVASSRTVVVK